MNKSSIIVLSLLSTPLAYGQLTWPEAGGDAGELLDTAQVVWGDPSDSLVLISGNLANLAAPGPGYIDDIDLYKVRVVNAAQFAVSFAGDSTWDGDATLFLFDANGSPVMNDGESGGGLLPAFLPGSLNGRPEGVYFLGLALFQTFYTVDLSGRLSGWNRAPFPDQEGPYTLTLAGVAPVPEASEWLVLTGLGLAAFAGYRRFAKRGS